MPLYEYRCVSCEQFFDRLVAYDAASPECPACGGEDVRRLISVIGGLGASGSTGAASAPSAGCGGCGAGCACAN
jgi:putative FmdB family regulatory protein